MAISSNNIQVYTTLSKELVAEIDKDAKANYRTRSQQINMILTEYYRLKQQPNMNPSNTLNCLKTQEISVFSYVFP